MTPVRCRGGEVDALSVALEQEASLRKLAGGLDFDPTQFVAAVGYHECDCMRIDCDAAPQGNLDPLFGRIRGYMSVQLTLEALRETEELIVSCSAIEQQPQAGG